MLELPALERASRVQARATARWIGARPFSPVGGAVAATGISVAIAGVVVGALPEDPIAWLITPLRLILLVALVVMVFMGSTRRTFQTAFDLPIVALLVAAGVATLAAGADLSTWRWLATVVVVYYVTVGARRSWTGTTKVLEMTVLVTVAITSLIALRQLVQHTPTGYCRLGFSTVVCTAPGAQVQVEGTFVNPNLLAAFLALTLPIAAVGAWNLLDPATRVVGLLVVGAGLAALVMTWSRAGVLGLLIATGFVTSIIAARRRRATAVVRIAVAVGFVVVLVVALAVGVGVRQEIWRTAVMTAIHHPLGVGVGRAGTYISQGVADNIQYAHAHNWWLNWLVEAGIAGFIAVITLTVLVVWRLRKAVRTGDHLSIALAAGLAGFAVTCLVDDPANVTSVAVPMMAVLGLVATAEVPSTGRRVAR